MPARYPDDVLVEIDARRYGAIGNGIHDDTAAIQAAIDEAAGNIPGFGGAEQGGTVVLTRGTFLVTSQLVVKNKVCLRGQGHSVTIILAKAGTFPTSTPVVRLGAATDPQGSYGSRLENLEVNAALVTGSIGIHSTTIQEHSGAFNVLIREFESKGIYIDGSGCQNFEFRDIDIGSTGTPTHGIHFNSIAGANHVHRVTINTENNLTYGIRQDGGETINYSSIHLETCTSGIYLAGSYAATLVGVDAHNDVTNIINIDPGSGGSLTGSMIMNTGATKTIWDQPRGLSHAVDEAFFYITDVGTGAAGKFRYFSSGAMPSFPNEQRFNVKAFGAKGDGSTDDTAAIQATINAVPQVDNPGWGGTVYFPPGFYKINSTIDLSGKFGLRLEGPWGISSFEGNSFGAYLFTGTPGMTMFTSWGLGDSGRLTSTLSHYGQIFEGLTLRDDAGDSTLVDVVGVNRMKFIRCSFRDAPDLGTPTASIGVSLIQGNTIDTSWHRFDDCVFNGLGTGIYTDGLHGMVNGGEFTYCTIGADLQPHASNWHFFGVKSDKGNPCYKVRGSHCTWHGCGWETTDAGATHKGWDINGDGVFAYSGLSNKLIACNATGAGGGSNNSFSIGSNAYDTVITGFSYTNCTVPTDSGIRTQFDVVGDFGSTGLVITRETSGTIAKWRNRVGGTTYDQLEIHDGYILLGGGGRLYSGAYIPNGITPGPVGSMFLRTNGGAGTTLYIKESGTGDTGWVAK